MNQLIDQPITLESRWISRLDLIITDQPNLFIDYGFIPNKDEIRECLNNIDSHYKLNKKFQGASWVAVRPVCEIHRSSLLLY